MINPVRATLAALLICCMPLAPAGCASSDSARSASAGGKAGGKKSGGRVGAPMPSVIVRELNGKRKIDLGALQGKAVLVDIWASWCAPCMEEMPLLDDMATRLKKKGIEIIAVSVDEDKESATTFLGSRPSWSLTVAHDPEGKVPEILRPAKMPTSYVLDGEGIIRFVNEGFERGDLAKLESRLKTLAGDAS
ncbi:MAG TPA: TlpA disulfide reductase family protein [Polyangia bacterium]|jgi:thiol-disulfide isomerase/thioredoxin|nr:TlpA disulfide reductase family protein [Polyangia bacterium]